MSALTHSLATLWSRFRWEILGYLLLVALSCISTSAESRWVSGVTSLRGLGLYWITFRVVLSEAGFSTHGGWRTRPFAWNSIFISQILLLMGALLPGCLAKIITIHHLFHPQFGQWILFLKSACHDSVIPWLLFILTLKGFEYVMRRQTLGRGRKLLWALLVIVLVPAFFVPASKVRKINESDGRYYPQNLSQGIQRLLPHATEFIGGWNQSERSAKLPQARLSARFPFPGSAPRSDMRVLSLKSSVENLKTCITLDLVVLDRTSFRLPGEAIPVLGYADGTYSVAISSRIYSGDLGGIASDLQRVIYQIEFASPLQLPENRHLSPSQFPPAELLFFVEDPDLPVVLASPEFAPDDRESIRRPLEALPTSIPLDLAVRQVLDSYGSINDPDSAEVVFRDHLPRAAMPTVVAYHPWADYAWTRVIRPFLQQQATEADKTELLQRLTLDPRLAQFFIEKGWSADALPVLREQAKQRLPLDTPTIMLLARQNDPSLNGDLVALAIRLDKGVEALAQEFRQNAAFDWSAFAASGWKSRKYGDYGREGWLYALWAAEQGDSSAFRRLAEKAAAGKKWESEHLPPLVAGEHTDLISYLRENIDQMKYDPATRKWGM